uniref:Small ribosomal subunit protein uS2c n=1 Tax=Stephanosphaera pluvialis TaxID=51712 RepID=A0A0S2IDY1_9CHLO|nr:ribosomal protein S2 [Stephanosphaera pluvialis]
MTTKLVKNTEKIKLLQSTSVSSGPAGQFPKYGQSQKRVKIGDICDLKITALGPNNIGIDEFSFPFTIFVPNVKYGSKIRAKIVKIAVSFGALNVSKKPMLSSPLGEGLVGRKSSFAPFNPTEDAGTVAYAVAQLMGPLPTPEGNSESPLDGRGRSSSPYANLTLAGGQQGLGGGVKSPVNPGDVLTVSIKKITPAENFVLGLGGIYGQKLTKKNNTNPSSSSTIPTEAEGSQTIGGQLPKGKGSVGVVELENNFTLIVPLGARGQEESPYENVKVMVTRIKHNYGFAKILSTTPLAVARSNSCGAIPKTSALMEQSPTITVSSVFGSKFTTTLPKNIKVYGKYAVFKVRTPSMAGGGHRAPSSTPPALGSSLSKTKGAQDGRSNITLKGNEYASPSLQDCDACKILFVKLDKGLKYGDKVRIKITLASLLLSSSTDLQDTKEVESSASKVRFLVGKILQVNPVKKIDKTALILNSIREMVNHGMHFGEKAVKCHARMKNYIWFKSSSYGLLAKAAKGNKSLLTPVSSRTLEGVAIRDLKNVNNTLASSIMPAYSFPTSTGLTFTRQPESQILGSLPGTDNARTGGSAPSNLAAYTPPTGGFTPSGSMAGPGHRAEGSTVSAAAQIIEFGAGALKSAEQNKESKGGITPKSQRIKKKNQKGGKSSSSLGISKIQKSLPLIKKGRHIINLLKTRRCLNQALNKLTKYALKGRTFLFIGTKKPASGLVARASFFTKNSFFVNTRWLGGMLTNWKTILKSISKIRPILKEKQKIVRDILERRQIIKSRLIKKALLLKNKSKLILKKGILLLESIKKASASYYASLLSTDSAGHSQGAIQQGPFTLLTYNACRPTPFDSYRGGLCPAVIGKKSVSSQAVPQETGENKKSMEPQEKLRNEYIIRNMNLLEKRQKYIKKRREFIMKTMLLKEKGLQISAKHKNIYNLLCIYAKKLRDYKYLYLLTSSIQNLKKAASEGTLSTFSTAAYGSGLSDPSNTQLLPPTSPLDKGEQQQLEATPSAKVNTLVSVSYNKLKDSKKLEAAPQGVKSGTIKNEFSDQGLTARMPWIIPNPPKVILNKIVLTMKNIYENNTLSNPVNSGLSSLNLGEGALALTSPPLYSPGLPVGQIQEAAEQYAQQTKQPKSEDSSSSPSPFDRSISKSQKEQEGVGLPITPLFGAYSPDGRKDRKSAAFVPSFAPLAWGWSPQGLKHNEINSENQRLSMNRNPLRSYYKNQRGRDQLRRSQGQKLRSAYQTNQIIVCSTLLSKFSGFGVYLKQVIKQLVTNIKILEAQSHHYAMELNKIKQLLTAFAATKQKYVLELQQLKSKNTKERSVLNIVKRQLKALDAQKKFLKFLPRLRYLPTPQTKITEIVQILLSRIVDPKLKYPIEKIYNQKYSYSRFAPKKYAAALQKKWQRLEKYFGGIANMTKLTKTQISSNVAIIIGQKEEMNAVYECKKYGIKMFSIVDTNCNPSLSDHIIPANDDSRSSIKYILTKFITRIRLAQKMRTRFPGIFKK